MPTADLPLVPGSRRVGATLRDGEPPSGMDAVRLRPVNRRMAQDLGEELADLYLASHETPPRAAYRRPGRRHFLNRLASDVRRPGFAMVVAETDHLVGCAFGFPIRNDGFWWLGYDGALPHSIGQLTGSDRVLRVTDVLVSPHPRDKSVARRLQERLLTDQRATLGATLVDRADQPTLTTLRSWGWLDVGEIWRPVSATVLRVLVLPVGARTAARPADPAHGAWTRWAG